VRVYTTCATPEQREAVTRAILERDGMYDHSGKFNEVTV